MCKNQTEPSMSRGHIRDQQFFFGANYLKRILTKQLHRYPSRASSPGSQHRPLKNNGRHVAAPRLPGGGTARCERFSSHESVLEILLHHSRRKNTVTSCKSALTRSYTTCTHTLSSLSPPSSSCSHQLDSELEHECLVRR